MLQKNRSVTLKGRKRLRAGKLSGLKMICCDIFTKASVSLQETRQIAAQARRSRASTAARTY